MTHTPDDWRLIPCDGNAYIVAPSDPRIIGDIATVHDMGDDTDGNAAMIKASPKLLAACEALMSLVAEAIMHGMPITQAVADIRNAAVAAIAEAKRTPSHEKIS